MALHAGNERVAAMLDEFADNPGGAGCIIQRNFTTYHAQGFLSMADDQVHAIL